MHYRPYDRIEQRILNADTGSTYLRWKWGRLVLSDPDLIHPNGRLKHGATDDLIAKAWAHGSKLSRAEAQRRLQAARTYQTEAEIASVLGQFANWWALIQAGFPTAEVPPDAPETPLFDAPESMPEGTFTEEASEGPEPYDPRPPYKRRDDAERQLSRILSSPEANGQDALPGMRMYLPGFTTDTVGPETLFREAFKIHRYIREEVTPQLRNAADQAERDDREREAKLNQLFDAVNRNPEASLAEGEAAYFSD
jgi:hypothetical protein